MVTTDPFPLGSRPDPDLLRQILNSPWAKISEEIEIPQYQEMIADG